VRAALVVLAVIAAPATAAADISKIIYLNPCVGGCQVTAATTSNSSTDESWIPLRNGVAGGNTVTLSQFRWSQETWDAIVQCVRDIYAPYDVAIVDEDPGNVVHHEVMVAGTGTELGYTPSESPGGVSSGGDGCDPDDGALSFVFANNTQSVGYLCAAAAQESAHSFGLPDHVYDCTDPMTYLFGCPTLFRNKLMPCGEYEEAPCRCGGSRVNTHVQLLGVFGPGAEPTPPTAAITYPAEGATITDNTIVTVNATDERGVQRVELLMNGWKWGQWDLPESITPPFSWPTTFTVDPTNGFPDGVIDLEVHVYNDLEGEAVDTRRVSKGAPCTSADSCLEGQRCDDEGRCLWDPPTGQFADACTYDQFCEGPNTYDGVCGTVDDVSMCTTVCYSGPNDTCPDEYECRPDNGVSGEGICWLPEPEQTCFDCSGGQGGSQPLLLGLGVGAIVLRRRRPRR
jgi:MYXO-CTERM domain-containing protein